MFAGSLSLAAPGTKMVSSSVEQVAVTIRGGKIGTISSSGLVLGSGFTGVKTYDHVENMMIQAEIDLEEKTEVYTNGARQMFYAPCSEQENTSTGLLEVILAQDGAIDNLSPIPDAPDGSMKGGKIAEEKNIRLDDGQFEIPLGFDELQLTNAGVGVLTRSLTLENLYADNTSENGLIFKHDGTSYPVLDLENLVDVQEPVFIDFQDVNGESSAPADGQTIISFPDASMSDADAFVLHEDNSNNSAFVIKRNGVGLEVVLRTFPIAVQTDGHGTASASRSSAATGDEITLTATPKIGYQFKAWHILEGDFTIRDNKFMMPAGNVTVKAIFEEIPVSSITIVSDVATITTKGGTLQLVAKVQPVNAKNPLVAWSSSNSGIATVDKNGLVKSKANGKVTIKATAQDGSGIFGTKELTITGQTTPPDTLWLLGIPQNGKMSLGESFTLIPRGVNDTNTGSTGWSYDSAFFSATFNSPATFTAKKAGTSTITYTASDGQTIAVTFTIQEKVVEPKPGPASSTAGKVPPTGDNNDWGIWLLLLGIGGVSTAGVLVLRRKRSLHSKA